MKNSATLHPIASAILLRSANVIRGLLMVRERLVGSTPSNPATSACVFPCSLICARILSAVVIIIRKIG